MKIDIRKYDYSIIWDGVYYHSLSDYPNISDWELKCIIQFVDYEKAHGRITEIVSDNPEVLDKVNYALSNRQNYYNIQRPVKVIECTACYQKGCVTDFLCHTASVENAVSIFKSGSLLSASKARNCTPDILSLESRNAAKDPADYFDYIMLAWGNCQAGDRLVMERKLQREPNEKDLSIGFTPGIRFYFKYDEMIRHPGATFDGYHPLKIKDQLVLLEYLYASIIPTEYESVFAPIIPNSISKKVFYINNDCNDIWEWSNKVYNFVKKI